MQSLIAGVVLTLFATASCYQEFQCEFESENLNVQNTEAEPGTYMWGGDVKPLEFKTNEDVQSFMEDIDEIRKKLYQDNVFDNFDSYLDTANELFDYLQLNHTESEEIDLSEKFITQYEPKISTYQDNLGLLVKFLRQISNDTKYPDLKNHYYITVGTNHKVDFATIEKETTESPTQFRKEYILGIIKISVNGKLGYVIIDMEYPINRTPYVMEDEPTVESFEESEVKYDKEHEPVKYHVVGSYVQADKFIYDETKKLFISSEKSLLIYVGQPLCNFVETHNRVTLLRTYSLSYLKFAPDYSVKAYVIAKLFPREESERFVLGYHENEGNDSDEKINFAVFEDVKNDENKMKVFHETEKSLGLESPTLLNKISNWEKRLDDYRKFDEKEE